MKKKDKSAGAAKADNSGIAIEKSLGGRPIDSNTYTPETGNLICNLLAEGKSLVSICRLPSMPYRSTVIRWVNRGYQEDAPEELRVFATSYTQAMEIRAEIHMDEIIDIADHKGNDIKLDAEGNPMFTDNGLPIIDHDNVQRAKLQIDARFKYAATLKPKKYGIIRSEISGPNGGAIETKDTTTTEQLARKVLFLLSAGVSDIESKN